MDDLISRQAALDAMNAKLEDIKKGVEETMRFKKPKNGHFYMYCYGCKHYTFKRQIGCAYIGECCAIPDDITEQDAYDPPCGLWEKKGKKDE